MKRMMMKWQAVIGLWKRAQKIKKGLPQTKCASLSLGFVYLRVWLYYSKQTRRKREGQGRRCGERGAHREALENDAHVSKAAPFCVWNFGLCSDEEAHDSQRELRNESVVIIYTTD